MSERGNVACCVAKMQEFETVRGQRRLAICLRANFFRNLAFLLENRKIVSKFREVFRKKNNNNNRVPSSNEIRGRYFDITVNPVSDYIDEKIGR